MYSFFATGCRSEDGSHGWFDVCAASGLGLEHEFLGGDGDEDDAGGGVESYVGASVVVDVFSSGVHPRAKEDCCW